MSFLSNPCLKISLCFIFSLFLLVSCKEEKHGIEVEQIGKTDVLKNSSERKKQAKKESSEKTESDRKDASSEESLHDFELEYHPADAGGQEKSESRKANFTVTKKDTELADDSLPSDLTASQLKSDGKSYEWKPQIRFDSSIGARIPAIAISGDDSILVICEETGSSGANGSVLIVYDTHSWKIRRIFEFPGEKTGKICFLPGRSEISIYFEAQKSSGKSDELIFFDIVEGRHLHRVRLNAPLSAIAPWNNGVLAISVLSGKSEIAHYAFDEKGFAEKRVESESGDAALAVFDENCAISFGASLVEFFDSDLKIFKKIPIGVPGFRRPDFAVFAGNRDRIATLGISASAYLFRGREHELISDSAASILAFFEDKLVFGEQMNGKLRFLSPLDLKDCAPPLIIEKAKPPCKGRPIFFASLRARSIYLVVDSFGEIGIYSLLKDRWKRIPTGKANEKAF